MKMKKAERNAEPAAQRRPRGRPRSDAADKALGEAARLEFVERGYRGMSMESIAARAGVSKVTLYRRWKTKAAVAAELLPRLTEVRPAEDQGSLKADLKALLENAFGLPSEKRFAGVLLRTMGEISDEPELLALYRTHLLEPRLDELRAVVKRARARGELRPGLSIDLACAMIAGPLFLYYLAEFAGLKTDLPADPAGALTKTILAGIAK
jgi:AcrR family transcriptional regulator